MGHIRLAFLPWVLLLALGLLMEACVPVVLPWSTPTATPTATVKEIVEQVRAAVVRIETLDGKRVGSGTMISTQGDVLTNYHLVKGYSEFAVRVQDRYPTVGFVVGYDEDLDLAILNVGGGSWPFVTITSSADSVREAQVTGSEAKALLVAALTTPLPEARFPSQITDA